MKEWVKRGRRQPLNKLMAGIGAKLNGHYQYYGVTDNDRGIGRFKEDVKGAAVQVAEPAKPETKLHEGRA